MAEKVGQATIVGAGGFLIAGLGYQPMFTGAALLTCAGALFFWGYFRLHRGTVATTPVVGSTAG